MTHYERLNYLTFATATMIGGCFIGFLVGLGIN